MTSMNETLAGVKKSSPVTINIYGPGRGHGRMTPKYERRLLRSTPL